jgi:hypothetical protein
MGLRTAEEGELGLVREFFTDRFGVSDAALSAWRFLATGSVIWAVRAHERLEEALDVLAVERSGLPLLRKVGRRWKPTTVALQVFDEHLTRNRVRLDRHALERLVAEGFLRGTLGGAEVGWVAVEGPDGIAGCGLYLGPRPEEDKPDGVLQSQFPKARWEGLREHLREGS